MRSLQKFFCLFAVCCFVLSPVLLAQGDDQMKAWQEYMTPGKIHEMLGKSAGEWKTSTKFWMAPGTDAMTTEGTSSNEMILGGRYLKQSAKGDMMGMPFEGIGIVGYDNATNEFTTIWIDNMGTGIMTGKGKWDDATKSITFTGMMVDPMAKKEVQYKEVYKIIDDNHQFMEMYSYGPDGKETKTMEMTMTKQ